MQFKICDFAAADLGAVVQLLEALRAQPDSAPVDIADFIANMSHGATTVVALAGGDVVGVASARVAGDRAWMQVVAISLQWRHQGIGSALTRRLEERLLHQGVRKISALLASGQVGERALLNRGFVANPGMMLYEKFLALEPSDIRTIDKWGGQILDGDLWSKAAGMEREKALIDGRIVAPLSDPSLAERIGLRPPATVMMFGPPGTGKTTFARAVAGRLGWPFVELLPSKMSSSDGTLANELREALAELGQLDHVVIFIDEFDEIAPARESRPASVGVVNQLLKSIPELRQRPGKLLICATNFVGAIDPAVMRPGRFDLLIGIGPPDAAALTALWERAIASMQLGPGVSASELAGQCRGFTPGDIDLAAQRAAAEAFARARKGGDGKSGQAAIVTREDLASAVQRTKASITLAMQEAFQAEVSNFERV
ncbi:MAG: GNAT family N-acetyltransferase [Planctomycetes bacterium]|nr:GNAT family N-acetyltransferase [Planctomycetota bacterium]